MSEGHSYGIYDFLFKDVASMATIGNVHVSRKDVI